MHARADVTALTGEGCTALHKAASGGYADIVKILISAAGGLATQLVSAHEFSSHLCKYSRFWKDLEAKSMVKFPCSIVGLAGQAKKEMYHAPLLWHLQKGAQLECLLSKGSWTRFY